MPALFYVLEKDINITYVIFIWGPQRIKHSQELIPALIALTILIIITIGIYLQNQPPTLHPQEILQYEGQDLSSISEFRENSIKGPQKISTSTYRIAITGLVNNKTSYTYNDVLTSFQTYQKVVTLHCVEGWSVKILWEGFLVKDLLQAAGIDNSSQVVIFRAHDGYSTSLSLDYIMNNEILMAYKMNGVVLPPERGFPFELVAESKWGYKWIKWITEIELSDNVDYKGYWESRGYQNNADIP